MENMLVLASKYPDSYGFRAEDAFQKATLGKAVPIYTISETDRAKYQPGQRVKPLLKSTGQWMFPVLSGTRVTHAWGGALGIPRDWCASVGLDRETGLAWAGGYVGDGVSTTNLAGRTLRDLVLGHDTELTRLPWVGHRSPAWEPEPLRWLGINLGLRAMTWADAEESLTRSPSLLAKAVSPLLG